jgi:hypothetical protein
MSQKQGAPAMNPDSPKSIQTVPMTSPRQVAGWKRWHHKSRILLMILAAAALIIYLVCTGLAKQYAGLGAALCAVACGLFLIWHAIHVFTEEDAIDEKLLNQTATSSPPLNPADQK